jgi:hypothetical protein
MRFDAYAATIKEVELPYVAESLASSLNGIVCKGRPMRRYVHTLTVDVGSRMAAWVGLDAASGSIYVEGKGETAPDLARAIRVRFPEHGVPRADVAEDYDQPGAFDALLSLVRSVKGSRVKGGYVALPDDMQDGKTWAAGVRGGEGFVRVYEAGKHPDRVHMGRPDWARIEGEFRPHYARDKAAASRMQPLEFWGLTAWTHKVGEAVAQVPITRFEPEIRRYSHDKTTRYIANTFRRHLEEMLENGEDIARTFQAVWEEQDDMQAKRGCRGRRP